MHSPQLPENGALTFAAIMAIIFSIVGFLGNLITILALPCVKRLRNSATWFVLNLAVTELTFCFIILPTTGYHLLSLRLYKEPIFKQDTCKLFVFLRYVLVQAELLSIAAVAFNRCILISVPRWYPAVFTTKKTIVYLMFIWCSSIVVMSFPLLGIYGAFDYNKYTQECDFRVQDKVQRQVFIAIGYLLPSCVIVATYSYIFYKAYQSSRKMDRSASGGPCARTRPAEGLRNRDMRIARSIAVIFVAFMLCCTPVSVGHFFGSQGAIPNLLLLLHPLYWLQYCLNVFIYVLMNKQYKDAYIQFISLIWPKFKMITERYGTRNDTSSTHQSEHHRS